MTTATYRLIQRGNRARDGSRWEEAAVAYRAALAGDHGLHHIRIQLGHMLKQAGALDEADAVYAEAAKLCVGDAEPVIHRAHLAKYRHGPGAAVALFIVALARGDRAGEAQHELREMLDLDNAISPDVLRSLLLETDLSDYQKGEPAGEASAPSAGNQRPLVFDITDLVGHFRYQRLPTGIQRVQIEMLDAVLRAHGADRMMLCCFVSGRSGMIAVPVERFRELVALAGSGSDIADPDWQKARARLFLNLALAEHMAIPPHAVLINLGTSLWVSDYFLFIRNAKARQRISYIPFVHDMIPIMAPEYCVRGIREEFAGWLAGLFQHADGFLANSRSTAHDLLLAASHLGHDVAMNRVEVVPLDADFRSAVDPLPEAALDRWGLRETAYALMVSTIEPRKNHVLAFDAWAELIRIHGAASVPRLVCVGRDGWLNDQVFARLAGNPALIAGVTIIHSVSDAEMALLYRSSCFMVYPSRYEGWGLPITESLCHGKVPVIADSSSLPEAGAGFALIFESGSVPALVRAVEQAAFDLRWRKEQEARIAAEFRPRSWSQITTQVVNAVSRIAADAMPAPVVPAVRCGTYYPVSLHRAAEIWPGLVSGEIFRIGDGWLWPEVAGCRTTPQGGTLQMRLADCGDQAEGETKPLRLYLRLRGLAAIDCPVIITAGDQNIRTTIQAGATAWVACDIAADATILSVTIKGLLAEQVTAPIGGRDRICPASIAVVGLLLCDSSDEAANQRAITAIDGWRGH